LVVISLASLVAAFWADLLYSQPRGKGGGPPAAPVEVATVVEQEVESRITLVGTAEPWLETVVAAQEEGVVQKMLVEEGASVKKGQPLCEQDADQLKLNIRAARASLAEEKVMLAQAERELGRQKRLFAIQSVSEKAYQDAQSAVEASKRKVERLRAQLNALQDQLKKKKVTAPVSGYVVERHCLVGQWMGEGQPAITLAVLDPIRVIIPVPERYISSVKIKDTAEVVFDALRGQTFKGVIVAVIPRADQATRTFPVRIELPNPSGAIKSGMLGRATLPVGNPYKALLVPKDALVLSGTRVSLYVVENQAARLVEVKTGPARGPLIEVEGDLKAGQEVVVRGNERLRPGQPVQVRPKKVPGQTKGPSIFAHEAA
jgi:membrane fusion protein (multidrug efflux system)